MVREIVRNQLIESMPIKEQLILEGISLPSIKDGIQFLVGGAAEYGLGAVTMPAAGAGLAVGPTAETMVDSLFAAEEIMSTIEGVLDFGKSAGDFAGLIQSAFEAFGGKSLEAFYDTLKEIVQKGLAMLGEKAGDAIDGLVAKLKDTIKTIIDGILGAISAGIKLVIPDAAIGSLAAEGIETVLSALADNAFSIMAKTIGKIKLFADFVSDPSIAVDFFKDVFGQVIELVRSAGKKLENMSWLKTAGLTAVGGPGVIALKTLGPTGLEKAADAIEKGLPTIMKLIDKVLTVLVPVMLACLGIFQILMKGEYKEEEGEDTDAGDGDKKDAASDDSDKKEALAAGRDLMITRRGLRRIIRENLPPWMIDAIRQREEEEERAQEQGRRLPLHRPPPPEDYPEEEEDLEDSRGVGIIDYRLKREGIKARITKQQLRKLIKEVILEDLL
jgi:hypothetical protein